MKIREKDWLRIKDILNRVLPKGVEVWAYGSRVRGDAHAGSDLDMALRSKDGTALPPQLLKALRACFTESNIPIAWKSTTYSRRPHHVRPALHRRGYGLLRSEELK